MKIISAVAILFFVALYPGITLAESDEICCTWINASYKSDKPPQKIMFHYDGTFATYNVKKPTDAIARGTFQIVKKWTDSDGSLLYQIVMNDPVQGRMFKFAKVSQGGKKLEFVSQPVSFPTEISASTSSYCTYVRASIN